MAVWVSGDLGSRLYTRRNFARDEIACSVSGIRFVRCDFTDASFALATLEHTTFVECDLSGTDFRLCDMDTVRFERCVWSGSTRWPTDMVVPSFDAQTLDEVGAGLGTWAPSWNAFKRQHLAEAS